MRLHADTVSYSNTGMFTYEVYARNILVPYIQSFTVNKQSNPIPVGCPGLRVNIFGAEEEKTTSPHANKCFSPSVKRAPQRLLAVIHFEIGPEASV